MTKYIDFELLVKKLGNNYKVEIETPYGKIWEEIDAKDMPDALKISRNHVLKERDIINYGNQLFDVFITKNVRAFFDNCCSRCEKQGNILRFLLKTDRESSRFFWELLYHKDYYFLCLNPGIFFARAISPHKVSAPPIKLPLRILLVTSNPLKIENELNLHSERDKIKWRLKDMEDSGSLSICYTDISTARNINEKLNEGYHIFHYCGHGVFSYKKFHLLLEDENGYATSTNIDDLLPSIIGSKTQLVIFDACYLADAAERMLQFGIPASIGMQKSILDSTTLTFFEEFYRALSSGDTIGVAFKKSRSSVIASHSIQNIDWAVPVLFLNTEDNLFTIEGEVKPVKMLVHEFGALPEAPKFVGRRQKIREIQDNVQDEDIKIIVIRGYGGIGKTSLVGKALREIQGYTIFSIMTPPAFNFGEFFQSFHRFLLKNGITDLSGSLENPDINQKVEALLSLLSENRIIIVFDGFENHVKNGSITDEGMALFLEKVVLEQLKSKVVITSKVTFGILEGRFSGCIADIVLDGFNLHESCRYLSNFGLGGLEEDQKTFLHEKTDGHPYALEVFVGLAKKFSVKKLLKDKSIYVGEIEEKFVGKLLSSLKLVERETLDRCAIFDIPVPIEALESMDVEQRILADILDLNLIQFDRNSGFYKVHSTTRDVVLSKLEKRQIETLHLKAAGFWEKRAEYTKNIWDILKIQDHYYEAKKYEKAAEIMGRAAESLHRLGYLQLTKERLERLEKKTEGLVKAGILHHLGVTYYLLRDYEKALSYCGRSLKIREEVGDTKGIAATLRNIGNVYCEKGDYEKALFYYEKSLEIEKELGDKIEIAKTLHNIGNAYCEKGDYEKALFYYEKSLEIEKELGDKIEIAKTLHNIGIIHHARKDYEKALFYYEKSLKIEKESGDKRGIAKSLHNIGYVHFEKGDHETALSYYKESLEIKEEVGDKRGIALLLGPMSRIYVERKDFKQAVKLTRLALAMSKYLEVPEKIATSDLQRIKETIGEQEFERMVKEVDSEVDAYLKRLT